MKLGFIGLGIMGAPMALHLVNAGHEVSYYAPRKVHAGVAESTATRRATPADVVRHADIVFTIVPDTPDVESVLFGEDGIATGLADGSVMADGSSR